MNRIEKLTNKQEELLSVYRDKWMEIGLSTKPADRAKAEDAIRRAYQVAGFDPPKQIIWATSPLAGSIVASVLKSDDLMKKIYEDFKKQTKTKAKRVKPGDSVGDSVRASVGDSVWDSVWDSVGASVRASVWDSVGDSVWDSVRASVWASVRASVWDSVGDSVWDSVRASVWDSVGDSVWDSVWDSVGASVGDSVWDSVWDSVGASVRASVWDSVGASVWDSVRASVWDSVGASVWDSVRASVWDSVWDSVRASVNDSVYGQHDANWLGFYNYFLEVLKLESCKKLIPLMDLAENANWWIPYRNVVIVSEKHNVCKLKNGRIHCAGGPSIQYTDGFAIWALNGVRVSQEIAETPADQLKSELILKERNAQVRAEIVKKIGIERVVKDLGSETVDQWRDYELLLLDLKDGRKRPYLKMKNQSVGLIHIEGVPPEIKTVKQALAWRNGMEQYVQPKILT